MALGIIAIAVVPLFALLPLGVTTQRQSIEDTTIAQIQQKVVGDLQRAEFGELLKVAALDPQIRHFNEQGYEVAEDALQVEDGRQYDVMVTLIHPPLVTGKANFNLIQADLRIALNPGGAKPDPFSGANTDPPIVRSALIAKSSK